MQSMKFAVPPYHQRCVPPTERWVLWLCDKISGDFGPSHGACVPQRMRRLRDLFQEGA